MAMVSRDPFAREELHKESLGKKAGTCDWCGNKDGHGVVYEFRIETDGGRIFPVKGKFCRKGCMTSFRY